MYDLSAIGFKSELRPGTQSVFLVNEGKLPTYSELSLEMISKIAEYVLTVDGKHQFDSTSNS